MDFYAVLDQIIALLQQRGRVSYQALKRQFDLDDAYIDDLKIELIDAQQVARDDNGRVLVWLGEASTAPARSTPGKTGQSLQPPLPTPPAERRQLTVMFCDLVGSTPLSEQLDPEDLREVVRAYQETCSAVIQRFDGYMAQLPGDALLVYFGWPRAHEDDAQRAVRTALGMLDAMHTLNARLTQDKGLHLAIRVGIHTGLVVVGAMGGGSHQEQLLMEDEFWSKVFRQTSVHVVGKPPLAEKPQNAFVTWCTAKCNPCAPRSWRSLHTRKLYLRNSSCNTHACVEIRWLLQTRISSVDSVLLRERAAKCVSP